MAIHIKIQTPKNIWRKYACNIDIIIRMYFKDTEQHHTPHFHAKYQEYEASVDFDGNILAGNLPPSQRKHVAAWADIHKNELIALWDIMQNEEDYFKIEGLR